MKSKITLFICLFLTLCFNSCENKSKEPNVYDFRESYGSFDYNLPVINVKMKNNKNIGFIVDSGSEANIISYSYYKNNKDLFEVIGTTDYILSTMDTENRMTGYIVRTVIEDSIVVDFTTMEINAMLNNVAAKQGATIKGILGVKFLYDNNVAIDFSNKKVITNNKLDYATI